jgi:stringent starvation protein B
MNSNKPYLLRAVYEWILDNKVTPHIVIHADNPEANVPLQYVEEGKIILNISPTAAQNLLIDNDGVSFNARFAGKPFSIYAPMGAVLALYANENGEGMMFEAEEIENPESQDAPPKETAPGLTAVDKPKKRSQKKKKSAKKPSLKIVK